MFKVSFNVICLFVLLMLKPTFSELRCQRQQHPFDISCDVKSIPELAALSNAREWESLIKTTDNENWICGPNFFAAFKSLETLNLQNSYAFHFDVNCFTGAEKLKQINLQQNALVNFDWKILPSTVKTVDLSQNFLRQIGLDENDSLPGIKNLSLNYNKLTAISITHKQLTSLEDLEVQSNELTSFEIDSNSLRSLALSGNTRLRAFIIKAPKLSVLSMNGIELSVITPETFQFIPNLKILNLNNCLIWRMKFPNLPQLTTLNLNDNHITRLGAIDFESFLQLDYLSIDRNIITSLDTIIGESFNLRQISCVKCSLSIVEDVLFAINFPLMEIIDLSENHLTSANIFLPSEAITSLMIEIVNLSKNSITKLTYSDFQLLDKLRTLDVSDNKIAELETGVFQFNIHLKDLNLSGNEIISIEPNIFTPLIDLDILNLARNRLSYFPVNYFNRIRVLNGLTSIYLDGNPWQCSCLEEIENWTYDHRIELKDRVLRAKGLQPICIVTQQQCVSNLDPKKLNNYICFFRDC